jgi:hypothetical protein
MPTEIEMDLPDRFWKSRARQIIIKDQGMDKP